MNILARLRHAIGGCTWRVHPAETTITGQSVGPWVYCPVCHHTIRVLDEPPADHPESMTAELPREQEEWLAALDHELWAKEAQ